MFRLATIIEEKYFLWGLIFVNIVAVFAGINYYLPQLRATPVWQWIFVADCPLAALLFSIFIFQVIKKKKRGLVGVFAFTTLIKYGFWTLMIFALYPKIYFGSDFWYFTLLSFFHIIMIAEAFLILHFQRFFVKDLFYAFSFLFVNDVMDYFFGTVPTIPLTHIEIIKVVAFISTFVVCRVGAKFTQVRERSLVRVRQIRL